MKAKTFFYRYPFAIYKQVRDGIASCNVPLCLRIRKKRNHANLYPNKFLVSDKLMHDKHLRIRFPPFFLTEKNLLIRDRTLFIALGEGGGF